MKKKWNRIFERAAPAVLAGVRWVLHVVGLYLDDLLLVGGGLCFIRAARELFGRPAALLVAGACMVAYAVVIARSRRGGGR